MQARPSFVLTRGYSAGHHALSKQEIEQRIMGVLRGFDKVDTGKVCSHAASLVRPKMSKHGESDIMK